MRIIYLLSFLYRIKKLQEMIQEFLVKEGDLAPDFTFKDPDTKELKLSDLRGEYVVFSFYPRDFTPGCTREAIEFITDYNKYIQNNITIIGISPDNEKSHLEFKKQMKIPFLLASDIEKNIAQKYRVIGLKTFMGKEYIGIHRTTFLIDKTGHILKIFYKVKPKGHSREILNYLINNER